MYFNIKPFALHAITVALAPVASAVLYAGFASTTSCSGDNFCEDNGSVCCSLPTGFGFSAEFGNLPAGTQGQGYIGSTCGNFLAIPPAHRPVHTMMKTGRKRRSRCPSAKQN
ncbi:hypothetical protein BDN71DRAFT_838035 [Pleurotus eryngii]|uniref:Hydrophobin n=1 Tax=Pleurotus eryngii TaxID=5323 RepID=A0A9P6ABK3_PLEER|nr:hypothetical protein BDN71DRAFT_838035 [Pleurotus eryngii]